MHWILSAIPAPGSGDEPWGREFRLYGIMIALGVIAALEVARRRWQARGGDPEDMSTVALWAVPAGLVGARLYHVITDNQEYRGHWFDNPFDNDLKSPLAIWQGGLGIPGGLALAFVVTVFVLRKRGMRVGPTFDALAPGVPLAQAIGRLGNYFNQELYGAPTDLPWAVEIDPRWRVPEYYDSATFHPAFLYEALWNLGLMALLIVVDKRWKLRPGRLGVLYVLGYALGRLWVESMRSDAANLILGLRVNTWVSLVAIVAALAVFILFGFKSRPGDNHEPYVDGHRFDPEKGIVPGPDAEATADAEVPDEATPAASPTAGSSPPAADPDGTVTAEAPEDPAGAVAVAEQPDDEPDDPPSAGEKPAPG